MKVFDADFRVVIEPRFDVAVRGTPTGTGIMNAVRLSGLAHLGDGLSVAATVAFNGNKLLPVADMPMVAGRLTTIRVSCNWGGPQMA